MNVSTATEETDVKRFFRARQKLIEPGFVSHITQRAAGKEALFIEDEDYLSFLSLLKKVVSRFSIACYAFCLMPNHVHLMFCPRENNLDKAMRYLFSGYATGFNRKYQRRGHLFGGPYRQAVCLDETYLLSASVYIHLNPVRAEISRQAIGKSGVAQAGRRLVEEIEKNEKLKRKIEALSGLLCMSRMKT